MKKKRLLTILGGICLVLVLVALPLVTACAKPPEKPIELTYVDGWKPNIWNSKHQPEMLKSFEKVTNGRVKTNWQGGGALLGAMDVYPGIVAGTADLGQSVFAFHPGRFPMMACCEQPGIPYNNARVAAYVAMDFSEKFKPKELDDIKILYLTSGGPGILLTDKPVRTLEDLKGLSIRTTGSTVPTAEALGATPVAMPNPETYVSLQKGIINGTFSAAADIIGQKWFEVAKYVTVHPMGTGNMISCMIMNKEKWDSLPPDIQEAIDKVVKEVGEHEVDLWTEYQGKALEEVKTVGVDVYFLPAEEGARWLETVKPVREKYIADLEAEGLPGKDAMAYILERVEYWNEKYPEQLGY